MSRRRLMVLTTVHHADDTRIREKLIRTLAPEWSITYVTRRPPPTDREGVVWMPMRGGRLRRNLSAGGHLLFGQYDVAMLHDPETLPAGLLAAVLRKRRVVFDVHEHIPAQISTKEWVPLRGFVAQVSAWLLRLAERVMAITLAEEGYAGLFRRSHPVFPNYPRLDSLPDPGGDPAPPSIVYIGDITRLRGAIVAVEAAAAARPTGGLVMIGPCRPELAAEIEVEADRLGLKLTMTGRLSHPEAMDHLVNARLALAPLADIPNYRDSLPTKVLEYLAMGVPVVASDLPGTRRIVGGRSGIRLASAGDLAVWRETVAQAYHDTALLDAARGGALAIRAEFGWPADAVRAFYRGL